MSTPTDLELMQYYDGELDAERRAEIEEFLATDAHARDKLIGTQVVGTWLRSLADGPEANLSERIMRSLDQEPTSAATGGADAPANDNAKPVYATVAVMLAAAASLVLWTKVSVMREDTRAAATAVVAAPQRFEVAAVAPVPDPDPSSGSVRSVDFGGAIGSIFVLPADAGSVASTVIWIQDE